MDKLKPREDEAEARLYTTPIQAAGTELRNAGGWALAHAAGSSIMCPTGCVASPPSDG